MGKQTGSKHYLDQNVYDAAIERMTKIYTEFKVVYLSFSAGKDSSVMVHLALEIATKLNKLPINVMFVDLEGNYRTTIKHTEEILLDPRVKAYWVCLPIHLRNAVSQYQSQWVCWDPNKQEKWIRPMPNYDCVISDQNYFPFYEYGMEFEEFVPAFGEWIAQGKNTACCVGIRSDESLNRFRTIVNKKKIRYRKEWSWSTRVTPNVSNVYPIYDWKTADIWIAVGKFNWSYNHLYDLMYLQGRSIHDQRICQPYGDDQRQGLDLFHECEPETWIKVVKRVPGANMGSLYRGNPLLGNIKPELPEYIQTWKEYCILLLSSMPRYEAAHYITKIRVYLAWWQYKGGIPLDLIPDTNDPKLEASKKAPSWRRIAKVLLKNDHLCKGLSFGQTKHQKAKWDTFFHQYEGDLKQYDVNE
jgi:predicted phosphoadenosine phosphosulfate sulfurtransferase